MKRGQYFLWVGLLVGISFIPSTAVQAENPPSLAWVRQFGSTGIDLGNAVTVDLSGNIFISGSTAGILGSSSAGGTDAYLSMFNSDGVLQWTRQLGTAKTDTSYGIAVDNRGGVYITGETMGNLARTIQGTKDAYVSKYDTSGNFLWTRQFGSNKGDSGREIATDNQGNCYVTGWTGGVMNDASFGSDDAFITKFDPNGSTLWPRQFGTKGRDYGQGVAVDAAGQVYVTGCTSMELGGHSSGDYDVYVRKYDTDGNALWTQQLGTPSYDDSYGVDVDSEGNCYIAGETLLSIENDDYDATISKIGPDGTLLWTRQLGIPNYCEESMDITVDAVGNCYITGWTNGEFNGGQGDRYEDAFIAKYNPAGTLLWTTQLGALLCSTNSQAITLYNQGNIYITGGTSGNLGATNAGQVDVFLAKYGAPEPTTLAFLILSGLACLWQRRR